MERFLSFMTATGALLLALVLTSLRRAHIRVEYSVSWLFAALTLVVISRWPSLLDATAALLGIAYPPVAAMLIIACMFLIMFYRSSLVMSKLRDDNIALAQRLAILEYHLQSLNNAAAKL
jgi:hypothetical protein